MVECHIVAVKEDAAMLRGHYIRGNHARDQDKDKEDKDKDVFIGPKEFVSHMMMTQTKDRLSHQLK